MYSSIGPRGTVDGARSRSLSGDTLPAITTPLPGFVRNRLAVTTLAAAGWALIASTTCLAVLVTAPVPPVASETRSALPLRLTLNAALLLPGSTSWAVRLLPPRCPYAFDVRTTVHLPSA